MQFKDFQGKLITIPDSVPSLREIPAFLPYFNLYLTALVSNYLEIEFRPLKKPSRSNNDYNCEIGVFAKKSQIELGCFSVPLSKFELDDCFTFTGEQVPFSVIEKKYRNYLLGVLQKELAAFNEKYVVKINLGSNVGGVECNICYLDVQYREHPKEVTAVPAWFSMDVWPQKNFKLHWVRLFPECPEFDFLATIYRCHEFWKDARSKTGLHSIFSNRLLQERWSRDKKEIEKLAEKVPALNRIPCSANKEQ